MLAANLLAAFFETQHPTLCEGVAGHSLLRPAIPGGKNSIFDNSWGVSALLIVVIPLVVVTCSVTSSPSFSAVPCVLRTPTSSDRPLLPPCGVQGMREWSAPRRVTYDASQTSLFPPRDSPDPEEGGGGVRKEMQCDSKRAARHDIKTGLADGSRPVCAGFGPNLPHGRRDGDEQQRRPCSSRRRRKSPPRPAAPPLLHRMDQHAPFLQRSVDLGGRSVGIPAVNLFCHPSRACRAES